MNSAAHFHKKDHLESSSRLQTRGIVMNWGGFYDVMMWGLTLGKEHKLREVIADLAKFVHVLEGSKKAPENFLATFATLATAEIRTFGILLGALPETFDAESQVWMADLLATCRGGRSSQFGKDLVQMDEKHAKARAAWALMEQYSKKRIAIEGFEAARYAQRMASQRGFHPPILGEIYSILHGGKQVDVQAFIMKCLDALGQRNMYPLPATFRSRPMK